MMRMKTKKRPHKAEVEPSSYMNKPGHGRVASH